MARFLLVPWHSGGHVPVALSLARHLGRRGHTVTVLGPETLAESVEPAGAAFVPYAGVEPLVLNRDGDMRKGWQILRPWANSFAIASNVHEQLQRSPADAVVVDAMLPAGFAGADRASVPAAALVTFLYTPWRDSWGSLGIQINETRRRLGLDALEDETPAALTEGRRIIVAVPRVIDFRPPRRWSRVSYVGPLLDPDPPPPWESPWPADDPRPLVLVTVSTHFIAVGTAMQTVLDALGSLPVRVLLTVGHAPDSDVLRPPENAVLHPWVPHEAVVPHASLVVTNAGVGTVGVALAHGVPVLAVPLVYEQTLTARRIEEVGIGVHVDDHVDVDEMRRTIQELLGPGSHRRQAAEIARKIDRRGGECAVRELESVR